MSWGIYGHCFGVYLSMLLYVMHIVQINIPYFEQGQWVSSLILSQHMRTKRTLRIHKNCQVVTKENSRHQESNIRFYAVDTWFATTYVLLHNFTGISNAVVRCVLMKAISKRFGTQEDSQMSQFYFVILFSILII